MMDYDEAIKLLQEHQDQRVTINLPGWNAEGMLGVARSGDGNTTNVSWRSGADQPLEGTLQLDRGGFKAASLDPVEYLVIVQTTNPNPGVWAIPVGGAWRIAFRFPEGASEAP
jgi:hypothetical protein